LETGKSVHDLAVKEKKWVTQEKWDEVFTFDNLIRPQFINK
jgi:aspartate ammonia-lyase